MTPSDPFDYDGVNELVQVELTIDGTPRKVIMQANRNGFLYVVERASGKLLAANKFVKVTWAERIDMRELPRRAIAKHQCRRDVRPSPAALRRS